MKTIWQSKTFWFNIITGFAAVAGSPEFANVFPEDGMKYVALVIVIGNIILRSMTTEPVAVTSMTDTRIEK